VNILVISAQFPYPPRSGFAMRVYQLTRQLARENRVTVLSYAGMQERDGATALAQELPVRTVQRERTTTGVKRAAQMASLISKRPYSCRDVHSRRFQQAIDDLCANETFDVIQLESSLLYAFNFPQGPRLVLDEHNIEYEVFQRMCDGERSMARRLFNRVECARFRRFEERSWEQADGCIVTSEREARILSARGVKTPLAVVPNGVDLEYFRPSPHEFEPNTLVFNGILTYRPNLDAAYHLIDDIWPRVLDRCPDAQLTLVGRAYPAELRNLSRPGVTITGEVPDIRPYLEQAAVVGVPIRMGGGTRLKVVEGLAMGKAMVSTSLGCEGVAVRDGEHLLIGDDADTFAARVVELFRDPAAGAQLGRAGRALVERDYSWSLAGERIEALYERVVGGQLSGTKESTSWPTPARV
jgi:polysaccharide biosynthesis protein PslH